VVEVLEVRVRGAGQSLLAAIQQNTHEINVAEVSKLLAFKCQMTVPVGNMQVRHRGALYGRESEFAVLRLPESQRAVL
jgi:hypothetical protein